MSGEEAQRCSDAARDRGDPLLATAPPAARLLLIEVPGPWGPAGLAASRLPATVSRPLAMRMDAAGVRVQLIRRPGRHAVRRDPGFAEAQTPGRPEGYAFALADSEAGAVRWGRWHRPIDLLAIDVAGPTDPAAAAATGLQRLALVCTHARRDVCCAVRGRPVAAAIAEDEALDRDLWETSHLGGDRFAANLLLLPEGELFGGLDPASAVDVVRRLDAGRLTLSFYRGRVGRAPAVQAAVHLAAAALDDDRRGAVRVIGAVRREGAEWVVPVGHEERGYVVRLGESWAVPERLTCSAISAKTVRRFALRSMTDEEGVRRAG